MAEACSYACMSINTMKKTILKGKIYGTKIAGGWTIDRESIDAFFNSERDTRRHQLAERRALT